MVHPATRRLGVVTDDLESRGFTLRSDGDVTLAVGGPTASTRRCTSSTHPTVRH
ncbi:hypothetical protein [Natronococcus roseus]|uniref:hypothetical protein n=1 Tax=Natronococcus roseus TaxID=1052014 RepID=UPI00374D9AF9